MGVILFLLDNGIKGDMMNIHTMISDTIAEVGVRKKILTLEEVRNLYCFIVVDGPDQCIEVVKSFYRNGIDTTN